MGRDPWLDAFRRATGSDLLMMVLRGELPDDGLQHAGRAILTIGLDRALEPIVTQLRERLVDRNWPGDVELADTIERHGAGNPSPLRTLDVDLDDLADVIDRSVASESFIDLQSGVVWPDQLLEFDQGPEDFDPDDREHWLLVRGLGPGPKREDMKRFVSSVTGPTLADRLTSALSGSDSFRRFLSTLERHPEEFTRWHRYRDDARLGRARHWLVENGYEPAA
jgi:hypothetical protein